jgi:predicted nucleic acid-binding protein
VESIVLDTDVASLSFKRALPASLLPHLIGRRPFVTFATLGELAKWADQRNWATPRRDRLNQWLSTIPVLPGTERVARTWGELSAFAARRGRPRPQNDTWIAACCLAYEMPLATLNIKDFADFATYEGLELAGHAPD